ncbi:MAG: hypothetical protein HKO65_04430 [Gemmatimonadetes bacterium]|nr:hypothetical protein [Gemmatimonadota bacterium]NNM04326.1 hypothetical protein [Gemmatimonadota bacterium]
MDRILEVMVGAFTLGLPALFFLLDQHARPNLRWIKADQSPPFWGQMVVVVGIGLAVLVALAAPFAGFVPTH